MPDRDAYEAYLRSPHWQRIRAALLDPARKPRCYCCNRRPLRNRCFDAHHVSYRNVGNEQPGDVVLVCRICHDLIHQLTNACWPVDIATARIRRMRGPRKITGCKRQRIPKTALRRYNHPLRPKPARSPLADPF